jgi:hypothetical protein
MKDTSFPNHGQVDGLRQEARLRLARNLPETVEEAEAYFEQTALPRQIETIGDWIDPPPKPLGDVFFERFAASVANAPEGYGRLFVHAIRAATGGPRNVA